MTKNGTTLDIFDLLNMKNRIVQNAVEKRWDEISDIKLTNSEWFILNRINYKKELLADVCKNEEITRQGTHKVIKKLEKQGLVETERLNSNKRNKYVQLTELGITCYEKNQALKQSIEDDLKNVLGQEKFEQLKEILRTDWRI